MPRNISTAPLDTKMRKIITKMGVLKITNRTPMITLRLLITITGSTLRNRITTLIIYTDTRQVHQSLMTIYTTIKMMTANTKNNQPATSTITVIITCSTIVTLTTSTTPALITVEYPPLMVADNPNIYITTTVKMFELIMKLITMTKPHSSSQEVSAAPLTTIITPV